VGVISQSSLPVFLRLPAKGGEVWVGSPDGSRVPSSSLLCGFGCRRSLLQVTVLVGCLPRSFNPLPLSVIKSPNHLSRGPTNLFLQPQLTFEIPILMGFFCLPPSACYPRTLRDPFKLSQLPLVVPPPTEVPYYFPSPLFPVLFLYTVSSTSFHRTFIFFSLSAQES